MTTGTRMNRAISGADADTASEDAATEIPEGLTVPAGCGGTEIGSAFARVDELPKRSHVRNRNAGPDPCQLRLFVSDRARRSQARDRGGNDTPEDAHSEAGARGLPDPSTPPAPRRREWDDEDA